MKHSFNIYHSKYDKAITEAGVFEIIISSKDGKDLKLIHRK